MAPPADPRSTPGTPPDAAPAPSFGRPPDAALDAAVERLAGRLRSLPQRRLKGGAADEALALARWMARQAQELESPAADPGGRREPRELPDEGLFAVGDQLAVAGHDLARAAESDPERGPGVRAQALEMLSRTAKAVG